MPYRKTARSSFPYKNLAHTICHLPKNLSRSPLHAPHMHQYTKYLQSPVTIPSIGECWQRFKTHKCLWATILCSPCIMPLFYRQRRRFRSSVCVFARQALKTTCNSIRFSYVFGWPNNLCCTFLGGWGWGDVDYEVYCVEYEYTVRQLMVLICELGGGKLGVGIVNKLIALV